MPLLRLILKNIAAKKILFLGTALSVVLGVSFVVGVFIVTDSLRAEFGELADDIAGNVDLRVRSELEFGDRLNAPTVDPALVADVEKVDGVAATSGAAFAFNVVIIKADGEPVPSVGPPQIGVSWSTTATLSEIYVAEGRRAEASDEFTVDIDTARNNDLVVGQEYRISLPAGTRTFRLVGTMNFGDPDANKTSGAQMVAFELATATEVLNGGAAYDEILVDVSAGADIAGVAAALEQTLPEGLEVVTVEQVAAEQNETFGQFITIFQNVLLAFAVITLVVSAFLINNVFSILIGQRVRELGLLRSLGATGAQITRSVLGESAAVGLLAAGLGLAGGIGVSAALKAIFSALGGEIPINPLQLEGRTVAVAIAVGLGVTVLASLSPALKARRVSPIAALRDDVRLSTVDVARSAIRGAAGLAAAIVLLALALAGDSWQGLIPLSVLAALAAYWGGKRLAPWAGRLAVLAVGVVLLVATAVADFGTVQLLVTLAMGALCTFVGINLTSALFARPLAQTLGAPLVLADGVMGQLARQNAARSPRRTASTAAALMIGLALVVMVGVAAASMKSTFREVLDEQVNANWYLCVGDCNDNFRGFSATLATDLEALPEIASVASYRALDDGFRTSDGSVHDLTSVDTADLSAHLDLDVVAGSTDDLAPGAMLVHADRAEEYGLSAGDTVDVEVVGGERVSWVVQGIYNDNNIVGSWVIAEETWRRHFDETQINGLTAITAGGVSEETARAAIGNAAVGYPQVEVLSEDELRELGASQIDQALLIVNIFLGLSLVIAILGIIATLALSVFERTRELGLLRAVGMTRRQMRRMVCWEGLVVAVFGGVLGVVLGVILGALTTDIVPDSVINTLTIPVGQILLYLVIAGVAGLVAGVLPAVWAGRLKVLDAIAYE